MSEELPIFSGGWQTAKLRRKLRGIDGIRIGPFGSALTLDQMVADGYKVYGQENVISDDFTAGSRYITSSKYAELEACSITSSDYDGNYRSMLCCPGWHTSWNYGFSPHSIKISEGGRSRLYGVAN